MIFSFDLDGTLVGHDGKVNQENINTIQEARKKGHTVVFTTGRPMEGIEKIHKLCPGDYWIASNGSMIYDAIRNKMIKDNIISKEIAITAMKTAGKYVNTLLIQANHKVQLNYKKPIYDYGFSYYDKIDWNMENPISDLPKGSLTNIRQLAAFGAKENPQGFIEFCDSHPILKVLNPIAIKMQTGDYWYDIPLKGTDKADALKTLQNYIDKNNEVLYHFGDSYNDLTAIQRNYGVAMENAHPNVKDVAIDVIGMCGTNSISKYLNEIM